MSYLNLEKEKNQNQTDNIIKLLTGEEDRSLDTLNRVISLEEKKNKLKKKLTRSWRRQPILWYIECYITSDTKKTKSEWSRKKEEVQERGEEIEENEELVKNKQPVASSIKQNRKGASEGRGSK